jgi:hypothetical protein
MPDNIGAYSPDLLTNIYNVQWGSAQQGLLAEYPPGPGAPLFENIQDVMKGIPTAYALDSGEAFPGINMGASGLGYTVLTKGLVCFGQPRDGDACFIAAPGFQYYSNGGSDALKRGFLDADGKLVWKDTGDGTGKLIALAFAGEAFFAVHAKANGGSTISTSFDGENWISNPAFSDEASMGGAVAAVRKNDGELLYTSCGEIAQPSEDIRNFVSNLAWATSTDGSVWSAGSNPGSMAEPGVNYGIISNYPCTVAAGEVTEDTEVGQEIKQIFVAAAATKKRIENPNDTNVPFAMLTAAPATSTTGESWTVTAIGLPAGLDQFSWGLAVVYCNGGQYFLMSDHEYISGEVGHAIPKSNLYKSSDGKNWAKIRTNINWMSTLSVVASNLSATTIVTLSA